MMRTKAVEWVEAQRLLTLHRTQQIAWDEMTRQDIVGEVEQIGNI